MALAPRTPGIYFHRTKTALVLTTAALRLKHVVSDDLRLTGFIPVAA